MLKMRNHVDYVLHPYGVGEYLKLLRPDYKMEDKFYEFADEWKNYNEEINGWHNSYYNRSNLFMLAYIPLIIVLNVVSKVLVITSTYFLHKM